MGGYPYNRTIPVQVDPGWSGTRVASRESKGHPEVTLFSDYPLLFFSFSFSLPSTTSSSALSFLPRAFHYSTHGSRWVGRCHAAHAAGRAPLDPPGAAPIGRDGGRRLAHHRVPWRTANQNAARATLQHHGCASARQTLGQPTAGRSAGGEGGPCAGSRLHGCIVRGAGDAEPCGMCVEATSLLGRQNQALVEPMQIKCSRLLLVPIRSGHGRRLDPARDRTLRTAPRIDSLWRAHCISV